MFRLERGYDSTLLYYTNSQGNSYSMIMLLLVLVYIEKLNKTITITNTKKSMDIIIMFKTRFNKYSIL